MITCKEVEAALRERSLSGLSLGEEQVTHFVTCQACQHYASSIETTLSHLEMKMDIPVDEDLILGAIRQGQGLKDLAKNRKANIGFILTCLVIVLISFMGLLQGFGLYLMVVQLLMVMVSPIILPLAIIKSRKGGDFVDQ